MQLQRFSKNLEARSQAEKLTVLAIALVALMLVYLSFAFDPLRADINTYTSQISSVESQIEAQRTSYASMLALSQEDPNKFATDRLAIVRQQQDVLLGEISALAGDLITPNQMTAILTSVLGQQTGLQLVSFSNEAAKPLRISEQTELANNPALLGLDRDSITGQVYEHGLTIEFEGDFFATLRYLRFLEGVTGSFFWDSIKFSQTDWPNAKITLMIHTLSTDEGFIGA